MLLLYIRMATSMYVCVRVHTCTFMHVRESAFVCGYLIKSLDVYACIISDVSGRVFKPY